jgi:hypothetical protein
MPWDPKFETDAKLAEIQTSSMKKIQYYRDEILKHATLPFDDSRDLEAYDKMLKNYLRLQRYNETREFKAFREIRRRETNEKIATMVEESIKLREKNHRSVMRLNKKYGVFKPSV